MKKTFFEKATLNQKMLFFVLGALMTIFSIYLTSHYFSAKYPTGFEAGSICNINSFFNCDATTLSPFGNIAGIPISIFGALMGAFVMLTFLYNNDEVESALLTVLGVNAFGCVVLFLYSLIGLGHLCPFCTLYYLASFGALFMLIKVGEIRGLNFKFISIYAIVTLAVAGITYSSVQSWESKKIQMSQSLVKMFYGLPNLGTPGTPSPFRLASATEKFEDAPIQFSIFSDFQCPACKALTTVVEKIAEKYKGKINIQYFFYPLDHNCNPNMERPLHTYACQAAYMASCADPAKFGPIHDDIFADQEKLSTTWINNYANKLGVTECMTKPETKESVVKMINQADTFSVRSTPTTLLNGVKIEGVRPLSDYYAIMDEILKRAKK
ncbi:thioredoxin domain-containing protein [Bacteriovorax sp. Seq25_V]|uniref:vitamin K epoxide reductase/DsbA family protein n=1 Tax=Bacteriovorax sp. Seq25_V TaxID=1201288 RepID=UPI00038A1E41|nr:thioredoxin domain-containing protein [Bacteriovorax sp. Seq25_V]EQC45725.1 vitamin K epoxide reductase family protein [Bacteriovorax sp. Seq25_V]